MLRTILGWTIAIAEFLVGMLALLGGGQREFESSTMGVLLIAALFLPASLMGLRHRRRAGILLLAGGLLVGSVAMRGDALWSLAVWCGLFGGLGAFWLVTHRLGWPELLATPRTRRWRVALPVVQTLAVAVLYVSLTMMWSAFFSRPPGPGPNMPTKPLTSDHAVFRGRVIFASHASGKPRQWPGEWGVIRVEEPFWGVPPWQRFVLVTGGVMWAGQEVIVPGFRVGFLTRYLPMFKGKADDQNSPIARLWLKQLRHPPRPGETRIAGMATLGKTPPSPWQYDSTAWQDVGQEIQKRLEWDLRRPPLAVLADTRIEATGEGRSWIVTTDQQGLFELSGIPPGTYTLRVLDVPEGQVQDTSAGLPKVTAAADWIDYCYLRTLWRDGRSAAPARPFPRR